VDAQALASMQGLFVAPQKGGEVKNIRKLELKICERCGGLWLRPAGSAWSYCGPCKVQVDELPTVRLKRPRRTGRGAR